VHVLVGQQARPRALEGFDQVALVQRDQWGNAFRFGGDQRASELVLGEVRLGRDLGVAGPIRSLCPHGHEAGHRAHREVP